MKSKNANNTKGDRYLQRSRPAPPTPSTLGTSNIDTFDFTLSYKLISKEKYNRKTKENCKERYEKETDRFEKSTKESLGAAMRARVDLMRQG